MNTENVANVGGAVAEQKSWGDVAMGVVNYGAGVLREAAARQQRRQDVLTLQHVWMYDEEEASRKAVDGSAKYAVYAEPRARHDESSLALYGRDYAAASMPGCKDDPWRCVEEQLKLVRGEEDRKRYREEFAKLRLKGGDTADDYYRLVGRMVRDEVRGVYEAKKAELRRKVALVDKMDRFAMGEDVLSEEELEDVRSVLEPEAMESAEAVREFMKVYVLPLEGQEDAEAVLRGISQLEDELFEVIGEDEGRAQLAYQAMMGFAQRLKDSNKMGVGDEFVVAVGKSLQNWANMVEYSALKAAAESSEKRSWANGVGWVSEDMAAKIRADERAMREKAKKDLAEYEARLASRAILREAINRSVELSRTEGFWPGSVRAASQMAGQTLPYFIPYVGMYAGTADVLVRGGTEAVEAHRFHGMGEADARGRAALDAVVQGAVELMPWSRVGGKGFSAFTRKWMGKGMAKGTSGALSRWVVRQTQSGVGRALMAEAAVGFVDEAVLEPLAAGFLTYGGEWLMDKAGVPHGASREFGKCFEELGAIWSDPRQVAGMALFSAGLAGSGYRAARQNVQYFAQFRNVWLATGLKQGQVDELMAIADVAERAKRGAAMVHEGWENDPAGMDKRVLKANRRLKERGEVLFMTGEGALAEEKRVPELQDAYRAVWNEYVERGVLPRVEARGENEFAIIEKGKPERVLDAAAADAYLHHAVEVAESVMMGEARTAVERMRGVNLRDEVADAVSRIAGNAAVRAVEAGSENSGMEVVDLVQGLPEEIAGPIVARGQVTLEDAAAISEYALGQIRALVEGGMSEQEARMTPAEAAGVARSLGEMATFAASFAKREAKANLAPGEKGAITIGRRRGVREVEFDGARVLGQVLMTLPGRVRHYGAVEDVTESVTDMMVQQRAQVIAEEAKGEVSLAAAEEQAWDELAEVVSRARAAVLKADKTAHIEEVKKGDKMGIIEALSTMAQAKFLTSKVVPRWMQGLTDALKGILGAGVAVEKVRAAYAAVLRKKPEALADIEKVLDRLGVHVGAVLREARVEAVDVQAWKSASAVAGVRAAGPLGVGGAAVSDVVRQVGEEADAAVAPRGGQTAAEFAEEAKRELDARVPGSNAPEHMRGVFVEDKCYYNDAGGFWCGMIAKEQLRDGTEQVKVGAKGKHGVIAGRELTGDFQQNVGAIYVWKRKNGELQVISGRHRFAKLMEDEGARYCNCYVFEEDAEHDEKWARMLDYENNMRDDQADEVTAATYVRETGLPDDVLRARGLLRNHSRSKRGVLIGRYAGQELWTRFANGAIKPKDAEVVVELTRSLKDKSRVDEIQGKCCMLLAKKKSWEYIAGMVQLMARAEAQMTQGLLDFGADFMADLERAAEWIEKSVQKINAALTVLKDGQSMANGRKKDDAARLGVHTETEADAEEMIRDLEMLKKQFEFIGSYPALLQQAELWDGKSEVDPIGYYLENARRERIEAAIEGEMSADEYLEAQARKMAEEAVPELFSMSMDGAQDVVAPVSFNVIGQKAETWGEYEGKAFAGRDDGMLRAEIDASQAKLKLQGISGKVLQELRDKVLAGMVEFEAAVGEEERADLVRYAELKKKGARHLTNAEIEEYRGLLRTGMGLEAQLFEALDGQVERDRVVELLTAPDRGRAVELYLQGRSKGDVEGLVYELEDVLEYPELYRAYPQLRGMRVELVQGMGRYHGVYSEKFGGIKLNAARSEEMLHSTLLHEVQHAIQYIEGFAKGGGESKAVELAGQDARYAGLRGFDLYQRLAGEIEARAVQARMGLDGAGRLARPFNEALEYPGEALTYRISEYEAAMDGGRSVVTFSMESVAAEWQNTLDGYLQNPAKPGTPEHTRDLVVCPTPAVMQMVGAKGWDMVVTPGVLDKVMRGKHAVSVEALRQLPAALAAPVCIAVSDTPGCLEVVTELKEGQHNVLVAVQLNSLRLGSRVVKVNRIASMYGKERIASLLNHPMLYWDKAKARPWIGDYRLQLPAMPYPRRASGRRIQTPADLVKYKMQSGLSFAMERASLQALEVLRTRADEREGERLMNDWQRACEGWAQLHVGGDDSRLGNGAKMLGEIHALIGATKGVLPEKYARMGHLHGLLRWAAVYAQMQQTGEVPESGVIAGPIYEKFVERMRYVDRKNAAFGLNEAEVKEAMAMLAGERLDVAMLKVATECKRRLELFLKDRERERIDWVVERAYPKREKGRRSPRGKMDADTYRRMERAYELMGMEAGAKAGLVERLKGVLEKLDSAPAEAVEVLRGMRHVVDVPEVDDVEALEELLEDELYLAETFGAWEAMAYEQARTASGAMAEMVLLGRNAWQQKLREERRRAAYDREEIARHFKVKLEDMLAERGDKGAKERARKRTIGKKIAMQTMSYSQLMLALEPMLGKRFAGRQMRMIAEAHERLQVGAQQRHEWMFKTLAQITGLQTEGEIEEWMVANNTVFDTGIDLEMPMKTKCRLTPEEAREWLRLTAEERAEKRQKMTEEAHAKGEKPDNVPGEDVLDELEGRLMEAEQSGLMPKEFVLETVWSYKTRLKCAKEALLFAILTFEQEDYAHLMEVNGLTDAKVQQMRELVGPQLLRWGYAMRKELSVHGKEMAEVYEAHTGVPFGMRNNYFTGVFDVARAKDKGEAVDQPAGVGGGKYGRLISRQHHNQQLNWQTSASAVFVGTMREQLNYVATSHISRSWQTLLADRLFERRLRAEIGDAALDLIQNWCQMIDGAVLADAKVDALMHRFLRRVMAAYAVSRLAGNVYTFMKQGSALLNGFVGGYVPEHVVAGNELVQHLTYRHIGFGEYVAAFAKAVSGKTEITAQELAKAGFIAGRKRVTGSHVEEAALLAPGQKVPGKLGRKMRALYEANMDAIGWADVAANTRAALAVAEVVYQQAKRENKDGLVPDAELRRVAIETAGLMIDRAAQPQLRTQKGYWAAGGGMFGALGNFFFMFKSEVLAKVGLYTAQMMAGKHGAWIVGALSFGVANSLVLALIDWIGGRWYDDDEDKWKKRLAKFSFNVVANDISSVPGVGDAVGDLRSAVLGEWSFGSSRLVDLVPFGEMGKYGAREVKNIAEGARWDKHVGALCGLARSVGAAGGWFQGGRSQTVNSCAELALAAANVSNWGRFFKDVGKKVEGKKKD